MALVKRSGIYYYRKVIAGKQAWRSTGFAVGTIASRKAAERRASEIDLEIRSENAGFSPPPPAPLYRDAVREYVEGPLSMTKRPQVGRADLNRSLAHWATRHLDEISVLDCEKLVEQMKKDGYKSGTIRATMIRSKTIFKRAVDQHILSSSPWDSLKLTKVENKTRVLTHDEQKQVPEFLLAPMPEDGLREPHEKTPEKGPGKGAGQKRHGKGRWPNTPEGRASAARNALTIARIFRLMIGTGLRISEVHTLAPVNVNWTTRMIQVIGKGNKPRAVPIRQGVEMILRDQMADRKAQLGRTLRAREPLFVMESSRQNRKMQFSFYHQLMNRTFAAVAAATNIPPFSSHDCRRTFGTRCAESGAVPMKTLQSWMGHSSISTTAEYYVHLNSDSNNAINRTGLNLE
jgi:integrase